MPYQNTIPQKTDILSQSQDDLLQNYTAIDPFLQSDHYSFNDAFPGLHKQMTFTKLDPGPLNTSISYGLWFSTLEVINNPTMLFAQRPRTRLNIPFNQLIQGSLLTTSYSILGYNIAMLTFPVTVNTNLTQPQTFDMPNPIRLPGVITHPTEGWIEFNNVFAYSLTILNNNLIFNDSNVYSYINSLQNPNRVSIQSFTRTGGFNNTATVLVTVIGSIS